jgi:hypothetical protein
LLIEHAIRQLRAQRKSVRALIGIDQHGGTEEALRLAVSMFSDARVYHDTAPFRTFHPKLYVVEGRSRARAIVGSGNLTEGGLETNYELAVEANLDITIAADAVILNELRSWFETRWNDSNASRKLTAGLIRRLLADPTVVVVPEAAVPPPPRRPTGPARGKAVSVFGGPVSGLRQRRRRPQPSRAAPTDSSDVATPTSARPGAHVPSRPLRAVTQPTARRVRDVVLAAGVTQERQAAFNRAVAEDFFGVSLRGELIHADAVDRGGVRHTMPPRPLVIPSGSQNRRFELPDAEGRRAAPGARQVILVRRLRRKRFEYLRLHPGDPGYLAMRREIQRRDPVGISRKEETKRVYLTLAEVRNAWRGCPF